MVRRPGTVFGLWLRTDAHAVDSFLRDAPEHIMSSAFPALLQHVRRKDMLKAVPFLLNNTDLHPALLATMTTLGTCCLSRLLVEVPKTKLAIVLRVPDPDKIVAVAMGVSSDRAGDVLVPVLQESESLLESVLVPVMCIAKEPRHIGMLANEVPVQVLLRLLRGLNAHDMVSVLDSMCCEDLGQEGNASVLLRSVADEPDLVDSKIVPLMQRGNGEKIAKMVHCVPPKKLLELLRRIELDDLLKLLEHTNIDLAIQVLNGPLEAAVSHCSSMVGLALNNPHIATAAERMTDRVNADIARVQNFVAKGKQERGAFADDSYHFGDMTRGLLAHVSEAVRDHRAETVRMGRAARGARETDDSQPSDLARGLFARVTGAVGNPANARTR